MFGTNRSEKNGAKQCGAMESKLIEYLDGRAVPAVRHAVEKHLSGCASCRTRAAELRSLYSVMEDLPAVSPSSSFDASLRARIATEPARRSFWDWMPSPRLAFAVTALVVLSVWISSGPRVIKSPSVMSQGIHEIHEIQESNEGNVSAQNDFGMIRDLPELENFDVISKFDALTELPVPAAASGEEMIKESR